MNKKIKEPNFLGLETSYNSSEVIILPIPFEITTSVVSGCKEAPLQILEASELVDLIIPHFINDEKPIIYMEKPDPMFLKINFSYYQKIIEQWINHYYNIPLDENYSEKFVIEELNNINKEFEKLYDFSYEKVKEYLKDGKLFGVIGGEHSINFGVVKAISEQYEKTFSILQIDAHCDLKNKYLGIDYSHASAMRNIMDNLSCKSLVQLGIRDLDEEESTCISQYNDNFNNIFTHFDYETTNLSVEKIIEKIFDQLADNIYISFDIDGLEPSLCPNTGTPVPGGFPYNKILSILQGIVNKGKKIIGFDLVEIGDCSEGGIDANVGARLTYFLSTLMVKSNKKL